MYWLYMSIILGVRVNLMLALKKSNWIGSVVYTSGVCLDISRMSVATFLQTYSSLSEKSKKLLDVWFLFPLFINLSNMYIHMYFQIKSLFLPFKHDNTAGNISASTTISAKSTECFAIWLNAEKTCLWNPMTIYLWKCIQSFLGIMTMTFKAISGKMNVTYL